MTGCVLFHVYEWDAFIERQAEAMARRSGGLDFVVLADETNGKLAVPKRFRKVASTRTSLQQLGLPMRPENKTLWWNLDYALYDAMMELPSYDYYMRFDADVRLTIDLLDVMQHMQERGVDWLTLPLRGVKGWHFEKSVATLPYAQLRFVPIMSLILSRDAAWHLFGERKRLAKSYVAGNAWAFCEGFVASALLDGDCEIGMLDAVADRTMFRSEGAIWQHDERLIEQGRMFHAVLDDERFRRKLERGIRHCLLTRNEAELAQMEYSAQRIGCASEFHDKRAALSDLVTA